jgi:pimeloyl-ACP methyl ester carboxylesterase
VSGTGVVATRDGLRLSYRLAGSGPLLVCQPGGPGRAASYLRDLGGLTDRRTLVLLDSRGTGASDRPDDDERLRFPHLAGDLEDLRNHLGLARMDLLGHSAGAIVAQAYAAEHPDRVGRLVLVTPSGRLQDAPDDTAEIVERRRGEEGYADALAEYDRTGFARPLMYGIWNDETAAHAAGADSEMDGRAERAFHPPPGSVDTAAIVAGLRAVSGPVLVVAGTKDAATGVAAARAVAASFPHARLEVLDGLGHFPWVEQPAAFVPVVTEFLASATV